METPTLFATRDGQRLAYKVLESERKDAIPLIMIMGWTAVKEDWQRLPELLRKRRPILILDNRGIGESDVPTGEFSIHEFVSDVLFLMDKVNWKVAHVFGVSMGGMIAQNLVLKAPHRVAKLIIGCSTAGFLDSKKIKRHQGGKVTVINPKAMENIMPSQPGESKREIIRRFSKINFTEKFLSENGEWFEKFVDGCLQQRRSPQGISLQLQAIRTHRVGDQLKEIKNPTLIIHGEDDELIPFANGEFLAKNIKNSKFYRLKECGHGFWTHVDEVGSVINNFLEENSTSKSSL